jgi:hypothetical protein
LLPEYQQQHTCTVWIQGTGALILALAGGWRWLDLGVGGAVLVTEPDGVRIMAGGTHSLLRRVPDPLVSVLEIGSTSPGALLYDARRLFDAQDARATAELLDILRAGNLPVAAATCLRAAAGELDPEKQAALVRAACYGRAYCSLDEGADREVAAAYSRQATVDVARKLRVLNALRDESGWYSSLSLYQCLVVDSFVVQGIACFDDIAFCLLVAN